VGIDLDDPNSINLLFEPQLARSDDEIVQQVGTITEIMLSMVGTTCKEKAEPMLQRNSRGLYCSGRLNQETLEKISGRVAVSGAYLQYLPSASTSSKVEIIEVVK